MKLILLVLLSSSILAFPKKPVTKDIPWEESCGGGGITTTSVAGKFVTIDAFVEHFAEARQWVCHFKDGKIVSASYSHFTVTRKSAGDAGEFTTELNQDQIQVFHFPNHKLTNMPSALKKDLSEVIALVTKKANKSQ